MNKKYFAALLVALISTMSLFGQKAMEANEKSPVGEGNAIVITLEGQHKNVEKVLEEKFKKLKDKSEKGFTVYRGQIFSEVSSDMLDYYWKVEKKGDNQSKIIFFISKGYDNFLTSRDNAPVVSKAKNMLESLVAEVRRYELGIAIAAQEKVLEDAVDEQEKLVKDQEKLAKDLEKLQEEIEENKQETANNKQAQEDQKKVIEEEKKVLSELKKQLSSVK